MMYKMKTLTAAMTLALVAGCTVTPFSDQEKHKPLQAFPTNLEVERSATYLREVTPEENLLRQKISLTGTLPLIDALRKQMTGVAIVPGDQNVDLGKPVQVFAQDMYLGDYLDYLESLTGYDLELNKDVLTIRSFLQKEWNLATFASKRAVKLKVGSSLKQGASGGGSSDASGTGSGDDNSIEGTFGDDEWSIIVSSAQQIVGTQASASQDNRQDLQQPFVQAVRSVGTLNAGGPAARIKALDAFLTSLKTQGMRQVNINVQAYDVTLNDKRGFGIDWTKLANIDGSINGNDFDVSISTAANRVLGETDKMFQTTVDYKSSSVDAKALLNFLSLYGDVELLNQPNVTVRNGSYAYISTGEEFSFVGEITREDQLGSVDGNLATTQKVSAVKIQSIRVGVTLAVTPRILDDGRIMLDIWPVISSQSGADEFKVATDTFTNPRIALSELSTEVITQSGRPIQLGGFIRKAIAKKLQELPWKDRITNALVSPIFRSEKNELDRRELVLTVTPTIVDGV